MSAVIKHRADIISLLIILACTAGLGYLMRSWQLDVTFISYRYIENLQAGTGFVFNPGQPVLLQSVSPPFIYMATASTQLVTELVLATNLVSMIAIGLGAVSIYYIVQPVGPISALVGTLAYLLFPLLWFSVGTELAVWLAFAAMTIWFQRAGWNIGAGAMLALAILVRPEAAILSAALLTESLLVGQSFRPAPLIVFGVLLGLGIVVGLTTFDVGGPLAAFNGLPGPMLLRNQPGAALLQLSPVWAVVPLLAIIGLISMVQFSSEKRWALVVGGWALLHTITLIVLPTPIGAFSLMPLYLALCVFAALGVSWIASFAAPNPNRKTPRPSGLRYAYAAVLVLPLILIAGAGAQSFAAIATRGPADLLVINTALPNRDAAQAGQWIDENSPPNAAIGIAELGTLSYFSRRPLLDYRGRLQADLADAYQRQDGSWWLGYYAPDYLVLNTDDSQQLGTYRPGDDPWFNTLYGTAASFGDYRIYQRITAPEPLTEEIVGVVEFDDGLSLNGQIGTDFSLDPLEADTLGRVQLNWLLNASINEPRHVAIRIQGRGEQASVVAINGRDIDFSNWSQRRFYETYHTLEVSPVLQPGVYDVAIGIGPDAFDLEWQTVTQAKVPFPEANVIGGFSGTRAEFGDIILLGYRLARPEDDLLDVSLNWQAADRPLADYRVVLQVRGEDGSILARIETEPHDGAYPTSVWSAGERVPDVYTIDISAIAPGGYNVYAGLVDTSGERLLTLDGEESVFVGRVNITE